MSRVPLVWAEQRDSFLLREALDRGHEVIALVRPKPYFRFTRKCWEFSVIDATFAIGS
jgi:putative NADH-flavin reductase